jgi:hypothetical protein
MEGDWYYGFTESGMSPPVTTEPTMSFAEILDILTDNTDAIEALVPGVTVAKAVAFAQWAASVEWFVDGDGAVDVIAQFVDYARQ